MAFLDGIKQSLKLDEVAGSVASKVTSAKSFLHEKQQSLSDSAPMRTVKEKVGAAAGNVGNYVGNLTPANWSKYFPTGGGKRQSPIDIITSEAKFDESLAGDAQLRFNYSAADCIELKNTGFSFQITASDTAQSTLTGLHIPDTYRLRQMHCHWGSEPMNGSEHLIGGVGYAGEVHLVHWNLKYPSFEEALKNPDGLAVVAVFLNAKWESILGNTESHDGNSNLDAIVNLLERVPYKGDVVALEHGFDVSRLIPDNKTEFWTYEGSLTTPPLSESAIWTVFRASVPISSSQLDKLRQLYAVDVESAERQPLRMVGNVRPVQPLNGRPVRASFRAGGVVEQPAANV